MNLNKEHKTVKWDIWILKQRSMCNKNPNIFTRIPQFKK